MLRFFLVENNCDFNLNKFVQQNKTIYLRFSNKHQKISIENPL